MKLISMTEFVIETAFGYGNEFMTAQQFCDKIIKYAEFLKQPITLGMFVPCNQDGKVLLGKPLSPASDSEWIRWENEEIEFYKARELILFEGFEVKNKTAWNNGHDFIVDKNEIFYPFWRNPVTGWELSTGLKTIEDLVIYGIELSNPTLVTINNLKT